ncbi:hypothetical protein PFISCL1PPCAC_22756 [Pristionchus fissidentatus]|uniref:Uncharacterized protein n=1 Tax=Pristionchus fissidentatus TaxID=1538716 RepID=A0AAV5WHC6_9BILA|nr:hypothetical protein PFISCL1PPCAC_22756 [Pristionchus fissidentatus]
MAAGGKRRCPLLLLTNLILQVIVSAAAGLPALHVEPAHLHDLVEQENKTVQITVSMNKEQYEAASASGDQWRISARSMHPNVADTQLTGEGQADDDDAEISYTAPFNASALSKFAAPQEEEKSGKNGSDVTASKKLPSSSRYYSMQTALTVRGKLLGKTGVEIRLVRMDMSPYAPGAPRATHDVRRLDSNDEDEEMREWRLAEEEGEESTSKVMDVWVKRGGDSERLTRIFVGTLMVLIPMANILMGCELDMGIVVETIKRPTAPLIGMTTQFLIMPTLAYFIAKSVFIPYKEYSLALGLFVTGCAPSGGASNFWTILLDGNVNLSVTMTFLSTIASLFFMPLWLTLLGEEFLVGFSSGSTIKVPYAKIGSSLASLVGPLLIGVLIARCKPALAAKARKIMRPFIIFVLVFVVGFGAVSNLYMFRMITTRALVGGLLLPWCGFMFGCFAAIFTRRAPGDVTAIAIETGIQNTGVAILLLKFSFPTPDSDISSLLPVIVACFTPGPLLAGAAIHMLLKWWKKRNGEDEDVEKSAPSGGSPSLNLVAPSPDPAGKEVRLVLPAGDQPSTGLMMIELQQVQQSQHVQPMPSRAEA